MNKKVACTCCNCCAERKKKVEERKQKAYNKNLQAFEKSITFEIFIGGRLRVLSFGRYAVEVFIKHIHKEALGSSFQYAVIFGGLCDRYWRTEVKQDFTFAQVIEWVDGLNNTKEGLKEMQRICESFIKSPLYKSWEAEVEGIENNIVKN